MNAAASRSSSCAISSSIFAQIGTARVAAPERNVLEPGQLRRPRSAVRQIRFVEIQNEEQRLGRQELKPSQPLASSASSCSARSGRPVFERRAAADRESPAPFAVPACCAFFESRSSRSRRRSTTPRSARMTSSSIVRTSRAGIDGTRRMRHRGIAEHPDDVQQRVGVAERRDVEQRLRARLAPVDAPAMSANSTVAGTCFLGLKSAVS